MESIFGGKLTYVGAVILLLGGGGGALYWSQRDVDAPVLPDQVETAALPSTPTAPDDLNVDKQSTAPAMAAPADDSDAPTSNPSGPTAESGVADGQDTSSDKQNSSPVESMAVTSDGDLEPATEQAALEHGSTPAKPVEDTADVTEDNAGLEKELPAPAAIILAPTFDEFRREEDGMTIIAGRAEPGSKVRIMLDGAEVASAIADSSGAFALISFLPSEATAQVLSLESELKGVVTLSDGEIFLTPAAPADDAPATELAALDPSKPQPQGDQDGESVLKSLLTETTEPADTVAVQTPVLQSDTTLADSNPVTQPADATDVTAELQAQLGEGQPAVPSEDVQSAQSGTADPGAAQTPLNEPSPQVSAQLDEDILATADAETAEISTGPEVGAAPQGIAQSPAISVASADAPEPEAGVARTAPAAAPVQGAVFRSDAGGVSLLQTPSPDVMTNVALDTIGYSEAGEVQLSGRAQREAVSVRIYLDNRALIDLAVTDDGSWRGELPDIDEGIYTLRVDEVTPDGTVASRVETPFKRESAEVLAAANAGQDGPIKAITVQKGATLWAIARERYGDGTFYVRVFEANAKLIKDPDLIYPGQVFDLPN